MSTSRSCRREMRAHRPSLPASSRFQALEDLRVIRETMQNSAAFTAVSGIGLFLIGVTALGASVVASRHLRHFDHWMLAWFKEAFVAILVAAISFGLKARRTGVLLFSGPGRRVLVGLLPALLAGAALTAVLYARGMADAAFVPAMWLMLYGAGVIAAGSHSIRVVPIMGATFMIIGLLAFFLPAQLQDACMASGFGFVHMVFGAIIAKRYGG